MQRDIFYCIASDYSFGCMQRNINICKEIYFTVLHIRMQRDINTCKEIYFIVLHIGMLRDKDMQRDIFYCIAWI